MRPYVARNEASLLAEARKAVARSRQCSKDMRTRQSDIVGSKLLPAIRLLDKVKVPAGASDDSDEEPLFHDGIEYNDAPGGNEYDDDGEDEHGNDSSDGAVLVASPSASSSDLDVDEDDEHSDRGTERAAKRKFSRPRFVKR